MVMSTKTFEGANLGLPLRCQLLAPVCHDSKLLRDISHDFLDIVQDDPQSDPSIALSELLQGAVQAHPAGFEQMLWVLLSKSCVQLVLGPCRFLSNCESLRQLTKSQG